MKTKKLLIALLSACLLSITVLPLTAFADVITEPKDSFWSRHQDECDYCYREYTANGENGYAILWESPGSLRQREVIVNGTNVQGSWHYTDAYGETWCAAWGGEGLGDVRGWIKLSECITVPDYISFQEAYGQEFVEYDHAYDHAFDGLENIVAWKYPCSGVMVSDKIETQWFREYASLEDVFHECWRDPQGRLWGYIGYLFGIRNRWVCLDDPANASLEADPSVLPDPSNAFLEADPSVLPQDIVIYPPADELPPAHSGVTGLAVAAVLAVVAVTALLIWFLFARKKDGRAAKE